MSKQLTLDPAEVIYRDLHPAIYRGVGRAALAAIEIASDLGRGAFRRFRDELADAPGGLARFFRFADDRRRGRARGWVAESGLRPAVPAAPAAPPAAPDGPDLRRRP